MAILSQIGLALERDTQLMASAQELRRLDRKRKFGMTLMTQRYATWPQSVGTFFYGSEFMSVIRR